MTHLREAVSAVLLLIAIGLASGQSTDSSLGGTVTDPSGAAVPGASVTAVNVRTGIATKTVTNEAGVYTFPALPPGLYRLEAEQKGFAKKLLQDITLEVGGRVSINIELSIGSLAETVEVSAEAETALGYANSSVGGMVTGRKVLELPLTSRNALGLVYMQAGVVGDNFAGARIGNLNIQVDGVNVMDQRINSGVFSTIFTSVDRIEEFRVITSPADAELGRGSGQVQMITRSGTNQFHGSAWWYLRNTVLNSNNWFNNQRGIDPNTGQPVTPRGNLIRNQFGGRAGGPVLRDRTFFHVLYEGQTIRAKYTTTATVLTDTARRGIFRFFPGVQNGNAIAHVPTVDVGGNPVRPPAATGDLASVSLFGRDPNRMAPDSTGTVAKLLALTPLPNNFRTGDGLNTAGYTWQWPDKFDNNQVSVKMDHLFTQAHRLSFSANIELSDEMNGFLAQPLPATKGGTYKDRADLFSLTMTSAFSSTLVNEFRAGIMRPWVRFYAPWEAHGTEILPNLRGVPYAFAFSTITNPVNIGNDPQGRISPNYQFFNKVAWNHGKHSLKFGGQVWFVSTNGFNSFTVLPRANAGAGGATVQNISTISGIGQNLGLAQNILNDLNGSLTSVQQALNSPGGSSPRFLAGETKNRVWQEREFAFFIQDDWKITKDLTLNLGLRYEFYGVPHDKNGKTAALVGGSANIFGYSGKDFSSLFRPGLAEGSETRVQLVGPNSSDPGQKLYNNDLNNWSPVAGFAWRLPWFGRNTTVLRGGYSIAYERFSLRLLDVVSGDQPGLREVVTHSSAGKLDLANLFLPLSPTAAPLATVPLTDRTQTVRTYDTGLRTPYVQNFNIGVERLLPMRMSLSVRYVGSTGTHLLRGSDINEHNIYENGLLDAFLVTQAGGNAPLFDRMFRNQRVGGALVDGVNLTGSQVLRDINTTTQGYFTSNSVGTLASYLNNNAYVTNIRGGLLSNGGLPHNFIVANPQFASARLFGNLSDSTYHSLQVELIKRMSTWTFQGNYTWSRALGDEEGAGQEQVDSYRTLRNRSLDKRLMSYHRTHVWRSNGIYELPFGPGRRWLRSSGWRKHAVGGWQVGSIFYLFSGAPLAVSSGAATVNNFGDNTAYVTGAVDKALGQARVTGDGVVYFTGLTQTLDPQIQNMTPSLRSRSTLRVIREGGENGPILFANPAPGVLGNLAPRILQGPGSFRLDLNVIKDVPITERVKMELRADFENATNHPQWGNPNLDINSLNFGRITSAGGTRIIVVSARINF